MIKNKTELFFEAGENDLALALEIFKLYKEDFKQETDYLEYDNYISNSSYDKGFTDKSKLSRFYNTVHCKNNLDTFSLLLLDQSLNYVTTSLKLAVLDYLLENRNELNIKDEIIVQFFVEKVYELEAACEDYSVDVDVFKKNLVEIVFKLIDYNVNFESDTQGYLAQIIGFNKVPNEEQVLIVLNEKGSNINNFLIRYSDCNNWINNEEEKELNSYDFNHNRQYNIYKKFDSINTISDETLKICKKISECFAVKPKIKI